MKKLIIDACNKTVFCFNNKINKQTDGVSMGSSFCTILANIIMTELESTVVKKLFN